MSLLIKLSFSNVSFPPSVVFHQLEDNALMKMMVPPHSSSFPQNFHGIVLHPQDYFKKITKEFPCLALNPDPNPKEFILRQGKKEILGKVPLRIDHSFHNLHLMRSRDLF